MFHHHYGKSLHHKEVVVLSYKVSGQTYLCTGAYVCAVIIHLMYFRQLGTGQADGEGGQAGGRGEQEQKSVMVRGEEEGEREEEGRESGGRDGSKGRKWEKSLD